MRVAVKVFYKNIHIEHLEYLPTDRPVILASNHPNAFMDAIALSVFTKQKLNYLTRSDVFNTRLSRWILGTIGLIPIYRLQEGADKLHKNEETFDKCNQLLGKKGTVLIFSEGLCIQEKRLRKLKKGTARIVFGAEKAYDYKLGLVVVPVGMNYSNGKKFRSDLFINFGKPIEASDYTDQYKEEKAKTINAFTQHLEKAMAELLVVIKHKTDDRFVDDIERIYKKQWMLKSGMNLDDPVAGFNASCQLAEMVNYFHDRQHEELEHAKHRVYGYVKELEHLSLKDHLLEDPTFYPVPLGKKIAGTSVLFVGAPIVTIGLIGNYIPIKIASVITGRVVKEKEFISSVIISVGTFLYLIFYLLLLMAVFLLTANWYIRLAYAILLPLTGYIVLKLHPVMKKLRKRWWFSTLIRSDKKAAEHLFKDRAKVMEELDKMRKTFLAETEGK